MITFQDLRISTDWEPGYTPASAAATAAAATRFLWSTSGQPLVGQPQPDAHTQPQPQPQPQPQHLSNEPVQAQQYVAGQAQPNGAGYPQQADTTNAQSQPDPQQQQQEAQAPPGPFVYDPNGHYDDPNVQAWAQYYAAGGDDPAGAVYFTSIPGIKAPPGGDPSAQQQGQPQGQQQGQQPHGPQSPTQGQPAPWTAQQPVHGHAQAAEGMGLTTTSPAQMGGGIGVYAGYQPQRTMSPSGTAPGADPYGQTYGQTPYGHPQQAV
jgi:signal transducing adaptor molecule